MNWLWVWEQWKDFALGIAAIFWIFAIVGMAKYAWEDPREWLRTILGGLAIVFGTLALLWAGHLADKYL